MLGVKSSRASRAAFDSSLVAIQEKNGAASIATSHTPLWLASGWGCRGRRLSRASGSPDTLLLLYWCRPAERKRVPVGDGPMRRYIRCERFRDDQEFSGIRPQLRCPDARSDKQGHEHRRDREKKSIHLPIHMEQPTEEHRRPLERHCG